MGRKNKRKKTTYCTRSPQIQQDFYLPQTRCTEANRAERTDRADYIGRRSAVHRGDIFFAELGYHNGTSVQSGCRPVLVISNDIGNHYSDTINVIPMTSADKRLDLPCHERIEPEEIKGRHSGHTFSAVTVLMEQITTISKSSLCGYVGRIEDTEVLCRIAEVMCAHLGMKQTITAEEKNNCILFPKINDF